jgi:hypothetical protein
MPLFICFVALSCNACEQHLVYKDEQDTWFKHMEHLVYKDEQDTWFKHMEHLVYKDEQDTWFKRIRLHDTPSIYFFLVIVASHVHAMTLPKVLHRILLKLRMHSTIFDVTDEFVGIHAVHV